MEYERENEREMEEYGWCAHCGSCLFDYADESLPDICAECGSKEVAVWRCLVDSALREAGGKLPWRDLCDHVVARASKAAAIGDLYADRSRWSDMALAHIPERYLSKQDCFVRLI